MIQYSHLKNFWEVTILQLQNFKYHYFFNIYYLFIDYLLFIFIFSFICNHCFKFLNKFSDYKSSIHYSITFGRLYVDFKF